MNKNNQNPSINKLTRTCGNKQRPICIWLTGLSGSGKSTIAKILKSRLDLDGYQCYVLDGDYLREGINSDLGFKDIDRKESVRRTAELARLMLETGLIVVVALISPFRDGRAFARSLFENNTFYEVFVDATIEKCIFRDTKGLYAKAISGQLQDFTGISSLYEPPSSPEVHLYTDDELPVDSVEKIFKVAIKKYVKKYS
jgi:adenylyl-sulfate kinase